MKKIKLLFLIAILLSTSIIFAEFQKTVIAVPHFNVSNSLDKAYAKTLADTMIVAFDKSGRIETKSDEDMKLLLKELDSTQAMGDCSASEACSRKLGQKMQVGYISKGSLSKLAGKFVITIRLIPILAELEIPTIQKEVSSSKFILTTVKKMIEEVSLVLPLQSSIIAINNDKVIIDLGKSHNLMKGNMFFVIREKKIRNSEGEIVFTKKKKIGKIEVVSVNNKNSEAEIDSGSNFKEGDLVILDQSKLLKKLKKDKEKLKEIEEAEEYRKNSQLGNSFFSFRLNGGSVLLDKSISQYYPNGYMINFDFFYLKNQRLIPNLRSYIRLGYRNHSNNNVKDDLPVASDVNSLVNKLNIYIINLDFSFQYPIFKLNIGIPLIFSVHSGLRLAYYNESAIGYFTSTTESTTINLSFYNIGFVGGGSMEFLISNIIGLYMEVDYSYEPAGETKVNTGGIQILAGITAKI